MAFDDETIRIQVDGAQANAALDKIGAEVLELEAELKKLNATVGVTNAEIDGTTRRLAQAKARYAEASAAVKEHAAAQKASGEESKSFADKYATLGIKVFGATKVLQAAGEAMRTVAIATGTYTGATKDAIDASAGLADSLASFDLAGVSRNLGQLAGVTTAWAQGLYEANVQLGKIVDQGAVKAFSDILAAQRDLVEGHKQEIAQLDLKAKALSREIELQQQNGKVSEFLKEKLQEYLDAYAKVHEEVPRILQEQAFELNVVSSETEKLGNKATEAHTKSATAAQTHADAIGKVAAEQEKVIANAARIIADIDAAAIKANQAAGDTGSAALGADAEKLKQQIKALEDTPIISPEQQRNLDDLKNALMDNARAAKELDQAFTVTAENFLTDDEAAAKYAATLSLLEDAQRKLAYEHEKALPTERELAENRWDNLAALNEMEDAAGDAGGTFRDLGKAVGNVSDEFSDLGKDAAKGTDKAAEGLGKIVEGAEEVKPLLGEILSLLQQIKTAAAEVDL